MRSRCIRGSVRIRILDRYGDPMIARAVYEGMYREPIIDAGTAMLDRIVWVARSALQEQVATLHPDRHEAVARQIRELIGN